MQNPEKLYRRRCEAGLKANQVASLAGISKSAMSQIENGKRGASPKVLAAIARAVGCEISELMADDVTKVPA